MMGSMTAVPEPKALDPRLRIIVAGIVILCAAAIVLGFFCLRRFQYFRTTAVAMSPNISPGDIFFVDRLAYDDVRGPKPGDVIAFIAPTFSSAPGAPNTPGVKRVVAGPGDSITISGGVLRRNGTVVPEPELGSRADYQLEIRDFMLYADGHPLDERRGVFMPPRARWSAPDRVPAGCYIVLGDNRAHSVDSHIIGFVCPGLPTTIDRVVPSIIGRVIMPPFWRVEKR
jgi:signal peptidase I